MLHFDIDRSRMDRVIFEIGASEKDIHLAFGRALNRTAATLRRMSQKGLREELDLRNAKDLRRRMRTLKLKRNTLDEIRLWYGTNDIRVSSFKGSPSKTSRGARFRRHDFPGAFVAKGDRGRKTIFKRRGRERTPIIEQKLPVQDQMNVYLEDEIFPDLDDIFFKHFANDLRRRSIYGVGGGRRNRRGR